MPTIKFLNAAGKYSDSIARESVISYIFQPSKTPSHIVGGVHVDLQNVAQSMREVAQFYGKDSRIRLRHFVLSFKPREIYSTAIPQMVAEEVCSRIGREYQIVYALHEDTQSPHIHFVFNPVSYVNGYKYQGTKQEHYGLQQLVKSVLYDFGIVGLYEVKYRPETNCLDE